MVAHLIFGGRLRIIREYSQKCIEEFVEAGEPKGIKQMKAENSKLNGDLVIELDLAKYIIEKKL